MQCFVKPYKLIVGDNTKYAFEGAVGITLILRQLPADPIGGTSLVILDQFGMIALARGLFHNF